MKQEPMILHIDLGNKSIQSWLRDNKYIVFSELIRYAERLIEDESEMIQAMLVSNLADNVVFIIKRDELSITLKKAMTYFLSIEEYEKCAKVRDLMNKL
jgi:hypothetical protein